MTKTKEPSTPKGSAFSSNKTYPARKDLGSIQHKFSPMKKMPAKHNNVFVKGFKFGLMCLELKKSTDPNEDAYFKNFLDILDTDVFVSEELGVIKVVYVCESSKFSIPKYSASGYKACYLLGIAPADKEHDESFHHMWAEKIIKYVNEEVKWKYPNSFKLRGDLTKLVNGKVAGCLDEALLDEDIGGFVGMYLFNAVDDIKNNTEIMGDIFGHPENREIGTSILFSNWKKWNGEEEYGLMLALFHSHFSPAN
jgi:hypothetical protein